MKILHGAAEGERFVQKLEQRMPGENPTTQLAVKSIVTQVRTQGLKGLLALREQFENVAQTEALSFSRTDLQNALHNATNNTTQTNNKVTLELEQALETSIGRVRRYHEIQAEKTAVLKEGTSFFASRVQPLDSVALYVPGGKAFYPSTVVMSAIPALVAGVKRIGVFTPARSLANPMFLKTVELLGLQEVHAVGGAQSVAAAAFGVEGIPRFDKIVGPGNIYVATAKQMLAGRIGIDGFAGPSEILILSDGTSPPAWIAADLLAQAEHDEQASAVLVTTCPAEALAIQAELEKILGTMGGNADIARASLAQWGAIVVVNTRTELLAIANSICSEHLHIHTQCALEPAGHEYWLENLKGVGAIFLGRYSAESFGDYLAGPSHVLPTAGTARFANPLGVYDFVRRSSVLSLSAELSSALAASTEAFALSEGLNAHALSARLRNAEGVKS